MKTKYTNNIFEDPNFMRRILDSKKYAVADGKSNLSDAAEVIPGLPITGSIMFNDNQIGFNGDQETRTILTSIFIGSRDDITFDGNQSECIVRKGNILIDTVVCGATVKVTGNAIRDYASSVGLSGYTYSDLLNTTMGNQSTYCLQVEGPKKGVINAHNLSLVELVHAGVCSKEDTRTVKGTIKYKIEPISDVEIEVKGTNIGALTDSDGNYIIEAPKRDVILLIRVSGTKRYGAVEAEIPVAVTENIKDITYLELQNNKITIEGLKK